MIVDAEEHGRQAALNEWFQQEQHANRKRTSRGVSARRQAADERRHNFLQAFEAAAANGGDLSVEKLAAQCGISKATAHRYLKQPKAKPKVTFRHAGNIAR
jgi:response regulator of citrate/malate metabolism